MHIMSQKTAVIYARFSCSKQREASIEDQLRVCRDWCAREGYAVVAEYCDYAISGRSDDRPKFQEMIANAGESDIVLVYMMDRFSRDEYDAPVYKRELRRKGVELYSAMEAMPDGPERILIEKIYEGLAAVESAKTAMRSRRGMEGNALKCMTNGVRCFGYRAGDDGRYEVVPEEAEVVREVFTRRLMGESVNSIATDLRMRGVRSRAGNPVKDTFVYNMLRNQKYRGIYEWGGIRVEDGMPRIVDDDVFLRVQEVKSAKSRQREDWGDFRLSGRVICAGCGRNMPGVSGRGKSGGKYEYYRCTSCGKVKPVRRDWLEGEIVAGIRSMLADRDAASRIAKLCCEGGMDEDMERGMRESQRSLAEAQRGIANLLKAVEQGIIIPGTEERVSELRTQEDRAKRDIARYKETVLDPDLFTEFLMVGATLDDDSLLDAFVYQVMVSTDEVVATLNYDTEKHEPARLNLSRVRTVCEWCPQRDSNPRYPP